MTTGDRFQRLEKLFHELDAADEATRRRRLSQLAGEDPELHARLLAMLGPASGVVKDEQQIEALADQGGLLVGLADQGDPERIGPYQLKRLLGAGGMGRVYLAEQKSPVRRTVALKLTRRGFDSLEAEARFRTERQALAVLDHPHIARVFDAGTSHDGRPWFAMEYIDGVPITDWAARRGLGLVDRIRLLLPVCEAVQQAHRKGLVHRDLKPSNILVIDDGKLGFPKVIDFGIARLVDFNFDEQTRLTRIGELVGTPEYMSPEQAALGEIDIDTRSDIYSLGLVLYELLVGELPISGPQLRALGFEAMCRAIREGETPRPSRYRAIDSVTDTATVGWRTRLKGDLDAVLLKALAKDRERRYGTAIELADDLRRYLNNEPVLAQPPSVSYRAMKFVRRHRWPVAASALFVLALAAGGIIASLGLVQARAAEQRAVAAARQAEDQRLIAEQNLARAEFFLGRANLFHMAREAYSDALQRMFGDEADVERQTAVLINRWRQAHERRAQEPEGAALLSYAIGRHFLFRNDYPTAVMVLETWLNEAYGPAELAELGRMLLPVLYLNLGRPEDAVPLLRQNVAGFAAGFEANSADHVAQATQLASITVDPADVASAEAVLLAARQRDHGPQIEVYFANQLALMRTLRGDLDGAHEALREAVAIIEANQLMDISGTDTARLNLATFEIYHSGDLEQAETLIVTVLGQAIERGESRESGRARELLGVIRAEQQALDEAVGLLEQATEQIRRFSGDRSQTLTFAMASLIEAQVDAGQLEQAADLLEQARLSLPAQDIRAVSATRLALAAAWLHRAMSPAADGPAPQLADLDPALIESNPILHHRYRALTSGSPAPGVLKVRAAVLRIDSQEHQFR